MSANGWLFSQSRLRSCWEGDLQSGRPWHACLVECFDVCFLPATLKSQDTLPAPLSFSLVPDLCGVVGPGARSDRYPVFWQLSVLAGTLIWKLLPVYSSLHCRGAFCRRSLAALFRDGCREFCAWATLAASYIEEFLSNVILHLGGRHHKGQFVEHA